MCVLPTYSMWYSDMMKDSTVKLGAEFGLKHLAVGDRRYEEEVSIYLL